MAPVMDLRHSLRDHVSAHDRGLLYGDGVFETIRCKAGNLVLRDLHQRRLLLSCDRLGITLDPSMLDDWLTSLSSAAPADDVVLKIIVTRGEGGRGYAPPTHPAYTLLAQWHQLPAATSDAWQEGMDCLLCHHPLSENIATAGIKHLNRLDQVMASRELATITAQYPSIREGLMFDQRARLIEGTRSNLFVVINNQVFTPDLARSGVAGVMRQWVLDSLAQEHVTVTVTDININTLRLASEMFICNSVFGIWPVLHVFQLDGNQLQLQASFDHTNVCRRLQTKAQDMFI